ncbi:MAG: extracellular solute-binding protein, partial [Acidimicrobiia bacterium]
MKPLRRSMAILAILALVLAACGGGGTGEDEPTTTSGAVTETTAAAVATTTAATEEPAEEVTIEWWHIQNTDPMMTLWQDMADEFMEANPNVQINITVMENEAFKAALQTNLQAGEVPDLFQSWGGGGLREQVDAGLVQDITDVSSGFIGNLNEGAVGLYNVDGVQYGIPFNLGMVGFWYNKDLFAQAGIDAPPATWDEFLEDVQALKDAGITPIAVGAGDKWPAHFYYSYLMIREGGEAAMAEVTETLDFNTPEFIEAGNQLQ